MARNLKRLTAYANRLAAKHDYNFVFAQVKRYGPAVAIPEKDTAKEWDKATRALITWAKDNGIEITLPNGWEP